MMSEEATNFTARHKILVSNPEKYLEIVENEIKQDPENKHGYFDRYQAFNRLGRCQEALRDINKNISIEESSIAYKCKGNLLAKIGRYSEALGAFNRAETLDPELWDQCFGFLFRANCYAPIGK